MKYIVTLIFILCYTIVLFGQNKSDELTVVKTWTGFKVYQNLEKYSHGEILDIMDKESEAYTLLRKASNANLGAAIISGLGGFIIGYELGSFSSSEGREFNVVPIMIGSAFILGSIPLNKSYKNKTYQAVAKYNNDLGSNKSTFNKYQATLNLNANGISLMVTF